MSHSTFREIPSRYLSSRTQSQVHKTDTRPNSRTSMSMNPSLSLSVPLSLVSTGNSQTPRNMGQGMEKKIGVGNKEEEREKKKESEREEVQQVKMTFEHAKEQIDIAWTTFVMTKLMEEKIKQTRKQHELAAANKHLKLAAMVLDLQGERFTFELELIRLESVKAFRELFDNPWLSNCWSTLTEMCNTHRDMFSSIKFALHKLPTDGLHVDMDAVLLSFQEAVATLQQVATISRELQPSCTEAVKLVSEINLLIVKEEQQLDEMSQKLKCLNVLETHNQSIALQLIQEAELRSKRV